MNSTNIPKINTKNITKEEIENLYFNQNMTLNQIGLHFGFYDRQPIQRLFKKFDIKKRTKSERSSNKNKDLYNFIDKETLISELKTHSVLQLARKYDVNRGRISKLMKLYNINNDYFINRELKEKINSVEYETYSPKELSILFDIDVTTIKYYKKSFIKFNYTKDQIIEKLNIYEYDLNNQGLSKQILYDDENLYNSILELTKNHFLQSNKITERLYRIINDYTKDQIDVCINTKDPLKFYTLKKGYGNSHLKVSKQGFVYTGVFNIGYSKISQKLFWELFELIPKPKRKKVRFAELNNEYKIKISPDLVSEDTNKYSYSTDFLFENKDIEFDGDYWHNIKSVKDRDIKRDKILTSMGYEILRVKEKDYKENPDKVIEQCINFLKP